MSEQQIKKIADIIIKKHKPEKIFLFGSFAWGKPERDSDVDLLIIKKSRKPSRKLAQEIDQSLTQREFPIDILVYSPEYLAKRISLGDFFAQKIVAEGTLLYEKK